MFFLRSFSLNPNFDLDPFKTTVLMEHFCKERYLFPYKENVIEALLYYSHHDIPKNQYFSFVGSGTLLASNCSKCLDLRRYKSIRGLRLSTYRKKCVLYVKLFKSFLTYNPLYYIHGSKIPRSFLTRASIFVNVQPLESSNDCTLCLRVYPSFSEAYLEYKLFVPAGWEDYDDNDFSYLDSTCLGDVMKESYFLAENFLSENVTKSVVNTLKLLCYF